MSIEKDDDIILSGNGVGETFQEILERRINRRDFLKTVGLTVAATALAQAGGAGVAQAADHGSQAAAPASQSGGVPFKAIKPVIQTSARPVVADGHNISVLVRWGDPITADAPAFDPKNLTGAAQEKQFGYNCDFVGVQPHPEAPNDATRALLVVNHEYTNPELMFSKWKGGDVSATKQTVDVELAAHGVSIVEIKREGSKWSVVQNSKYNRRFTGTTPMNVDGPAAGNDLLKTSADPTGTKIAGTLNNCAGGKTPWGTVLSCEENYDQYFGNFAALPDTNPVKAYHKRGGEFYGQKTSERGWEKVYDRFDMAKEPNEAFRFGWVVEIDPTDPTSTPVKHTALGRFKHEAATFALAKSGQAVFYTGDDARFEYVYKFVSKGKYNPNDRKANMNLLSEGTLYAAKFNDDGTGQWLPLVFGQGKLTAPTFRNQGDVVIRAREAADLQGATKMDRPEDIEQNPVNKKIYMVMTNNSQRGAEGKPAVDKSNPRPDNRTGHIIEVTEADDDPGATTFKWEIFMLCGNPARENPDQPNSQTYFAGFDKKKVSPIAAPDNITFDVDGNLWIATDGAARPIGFNDGLFAVPVAGPNRGELKQFFSTVFGSEICGPEFTADNTALFLAIQHPGEASGSTFDTPGTRWPDNRRGVPPRPSVIVIQNNDPKKRVGAA
jgi:secreted PhoX family phosphatase